MKKSELLYQLKLIYADLLCSNSHIVTYKDFYAVGFLNTASHHLDFAMDRLEELIFVLEDK